MLLFASLPGIFPHGSSSSSSCFEGRESQKNTRRRGRAPPGNDPGLARTGRCFSGEDERDDQPVQGEGLGENEDEDHDDEQLGLLRRGTHAGVSHDPDTDPGSQSRKTIGQARCEMCKAEEVRVATLSDLTDKDNGDDEPVDTQHTSHDHRDDAAHHELRPHDTHRRDTDAGLGGAVGGAQVGEDEGRRGAGEAEERGCCWARHGGAGGGCGWGGGERERRREGGGVGGLVGCVRGRTRKN